MFIRFIAICILLSCSSAFAQVDRIWLGQAIESDEDGETVVDFIDFCRSEGRFAKHFDKEGNPSETLLRAKQERLENWKQLQELAGLLDKKKPEHDKEPQ